MYDEYSNMTDEELDAEIARIQGEGDGFKTVDEMTDEELDAAIAEASAPAKPKPIETDNHTLDNIGKVGFMHRKEDYANASPMGGVTKSALQAQASGAPVADDDDGSFGSWLSNLWKSVAYNSTGKVTASAINKNTQDLARGTVRGWDGIERRLEDLPDSETDYLVDASGFNGIASYFGRFLGRTVSGWTQSDDSPMKQWDNTIGAKISDPQERHLARVAYARSLAGGVVAQGVEERQAAQVELEGREVATGGDLVAGLVTNGAYMLPYMAFLGRDKGVVAGLVEGSTRANELLSDKLTTDEEGNIRVEAERDKLGTALTKGAARGVIAPAIEMVGGTLATKGIEKLAGATIGKVPLLQRVGDGIAESAVGKALTRYANSMNFIGKITGMQGFPEEVIEELEDQVADAALGLDRRESEKAGTSALERGAEAFTDFFKPKNLWDLTKSMLLVQAIGGGAGYARNRIASRNIDGVLTNVCGVDRSVLGNYSPEEKQAAYYAWINNLSAEEVEQTFKDGAKAVNEVAARIAERAGSFNFGQQSESADAESGDAAGAPTFTVPSRVNEETGASEIAWEDSTDDSGRATRRITDANTGISIDAITDEDGNTAYRIYDNSGEEGKPRRSRSARTEADALAAANDIAATAKVRDAKLAYIDMLREQGGLLSGVEVVTGDSLSDALDALERQYGREAREAVTGGEEFNSGNAKGNPSLHFKLADGREGVLFALDNIQNARELANYANHEAVVHSGLANMFNTPEEKAKFLSRVGEQGLRGLDAEAYQQALAAQMQQHGYTDPKQIYRDPVAVEEMFAWMTERIQSSPSMVDRAVSYVRDLYRKNFNEDLQYNANEVVTMLGALRERAKSGEGDLQTTYVSDQESKQRGADAIYAQEDYEREQREKAEEFRRNAQRPQLGYTIQMPEGEAEAFARKWEEDPVAAMRDFNEKMKSMPRDEAAIAARQFIAQMREEAANAPRQIEDRHGEVPIVTPQTEAHGRMQQFREKLKTDPAAAIDEFRRALEFTGREEEARQLREFAEYLRGAKTAAANAPQQVEYKPAATMQNPNYDLQPISERQGEMLLKEMLNGGRTAQGGTPTAPTNTSTTPAKPTTSTTPTTPAPTDAVRTAVTKMRDAFAALDGKAGKAAEAELREALRNGGTMPSAEEIAELAKNLPTKKMREAFTQNMETLRAWAKGNAKESDDGKPVTPAKPVKPAKPKGKKKAPLVPTKKKSEEKKKRQGPNAELSYEDYGEATGDHIGASLLRNGTGFFIPEGYSNYRRALGNWKRHKGQKRTANGAIVSIPKPKPSNFGVDDPLTDLFDELLDGASRSMKIMLFGFRPKTGSNDDFLERIADDDLAVAGHLGFFSEGIEDNGTGIDVEEVARRVVNEMQEAYAHYSEWVDERREERRKAKEEARDRQDDYESYDFPQLFADLERADSEFAAVADEIASTETKFDGKNVAPFSRENLSKTAEGDTLRFDHDNYAYTIINYNKDAGVLTLRDDAHDAVFDEFEEYQVSENGIARITSDEAISLFNEAQNKRDAKEREEENEARQAEYAERDADLRAEEAANGQREEEVSDANHDGNATGERNEQVGEDFSLESVSGDQIKREEKKRAERAEIARRVAKPLKGGGPVNVQPQFDLGDTYGDLFNPVVRNGDGASGGGGASAKWRTSGLYTGSAADYEKPSLHAVGTGEGSQVYGWGLYASNVRKVGEIYANAIAQSHKGDPVKWTIDGKPIADYGIYPEDFPIKGNDLEWWSNLHDALDDVYDEEMPPKELLAKAFAHLLEDYPWAEDFIDRFKDRIDITIDKTKPDEYLYEQTFFTNRGPGDESHLLEWYEPISNEQHKWIEDGIRKTFKVIDLDGREVVMPEGKTDPSEDGLSLEFILGDGTDTGVVVTGGNIYYDMKRLLGSAKAASEWLAAHGIDGVKYPANSYGRTKQDGDKWGWNYVSFRDDNISVDHKWVNGEMQWRRAYAPDAQLRSLADAYGLTKEEARVLFGGAAFNLAQSPLMRQTMFPTEASLVNDIPTEPGAANAARGAVNVMRDLTSAGASSKWQALMDGLGRRLWDYMLPMRRAEEWIGRKRGRAVSAEESVHAAAKFAYGRQTYLLGQLRNDVLQPLAKEIADGKLNAPSRRIQGATVLHELLLALHGPAFNRMIAERTDGAKLDGSGRSTKYWNESLRAMGARATDAEIEAALKSGDYAALKFAPGSVGAKAAKAVSLVREMNRRTRDALVKSGRLSAEQRDVWEKESPFYVPLRFDVDADQNLVETWFYGMPESGGNVPGAKGYGKSETKHAFGHDGISNNPIAFSIQQAETAILRATDNEMRTKLAALVRANPEMGRVIDPSSDAEKWMLPTRNVLGVNGKAHKVPDVVGIEEKFENIVAFKENGDLKFIVLGHSPAAGATGRAEANNLPQREAALIGRAVKKQSLAKMGGILRMVRSLTRTFGILRTSASPEFLVSNFLADNGQAARNLYATYGAKAAATFERFVPASMGTARRLINHKLGASKLDRYADEMQRVGGLIGGFATENFRDIEGQIARDVRLFAGDRKAKLVDFLSTIGEKLNGPVELSTRIAAYATCRENGASIAEAAKYAREVTVDFNQKGEWSPVLNALYAFSNASLVDMQRSMGAFLAKKGGRMAIGLFLMGFISSMFGFGQDDPEDERNGVPQWKDTKDYRKQNQMGVRIGGAFFSVPIRGLSRVAYYAGHKAYEAMSGRAGAGEAAVDVAGFLASNAFDPMGDVTKPLQAVTPSVMRPAVELAQNESFSGSQIYRRPNDRRQVRSMMGRHSTPAVWHGIAKALNSLTGGNAVRRGLIDAQPEVLQHYYSWLTGSAGNDVARATNLIAALTTGSAGDMEVRNVPFLRRFASGLDANSGRYAEAMDAFKVDLDEYEKIAPEDPDVRRELERKSPVFRPGGAAKRAREEMKDLMNAQKNLMSLEMQSDGDSRKEIHELRMKVQAAFLRKAAATDETPPDTAQERKADADRNRIVSRLLSKSKREKKIEARKREAELRRAAHRNPIVK